MSLIRKLWGYWYQLAVFINKEPPPPRQPKYEKAYGNRVQEQSSRRCRIRTAAWWGCVFCHVNEPPPG